MKNIFFSALVVCFGLIVATTDCLHADTFTVTTTNISGPGSLPVAIAQANATPGDNQIQISVTNPIILGLALPTITNNVAITGNATVPTVISGGRTLPLFYFAEGTTNSLSNLVLANGYSTNTVAAIRNYSILSVSSCVITNNIFGLINIQGGVINNYGVMAISSSEISANSGGNGGAIYNAGTMTINNSQLIGNNSAVNGGAIYNAGSGYLAVSTINISSNSAASGGAIYNAAGILTISKSAFVANNAYGYNSGNPVPVSGGGAIFSSSGSVGITNSTFYQNAVEYAIAGSTNGGGAISVLNGNCALVNCTVANNSSTTFSNMGQGQGIAGGIYNNSGSVTLLNTIIAGNNGTNSSPDIFGTFISSGSNLIGNNQGATGLSLFDFQNVSANLGPLQNNGGPTLTCVPLPGSLAIGNGTSAGAPNTDQRGVPRPQNGAFDIGAVQVATSSPFVTGAAMSSGSGFSLNTIFDATNSYRIQASTNLTAWINIFTNGSGGGINFIDPAATNFNRRFYRTATP